MRPDSIKFGGGVAATIVNPIVVLAVLVAGALIIFSPRHRALAALLFAGIWIPTDQIMVLGGVHFPMLRILAICGFARVYWRKTNSGETIFAGGVNAIDTWAIILATFVALDGMLLWRQSAEIINQAGVLCTTFGVYFLIRSLIRDEGDVTRAMRLLAIVAAPIGILMVYESISGHNPYYEFLGGARADMYSSALQRADHFRATGCFAHPIIAGTFGGMLVPVFIALWKVDKKSRKWAVVGVLSGVAISFAVASTTALFALMAGLGALLWWPLRRWMRAVRWGIVVTLIGLQMVMKSPVWHIVDDISLSSGSSSYHRYMLIDQCIRHFWSWFLVGTKDYASWGWDMWDMSNQYVAYADTAGLIPLIAFVGILAYAFKYLGHARRYFKGEKPQEFFIWAIAASLFANTVAFWGISYWDQIIVAWYALLAIISIVTLPARLKVAKPALAATSTAVAVPRRRLEPISIKGR